MTLIEWLFLGAVWCACASLLHRPVRTRKSMLPSGVLLWTMAYTLSRPPIYSLVDPLLGGENITNLIYRVLMISALGCSAVMLLRATSGRRRKVEAGTAAATIGFCLVQIALFFPERWSTSDTYLIAPSGTWGRELFYDLLPLCIAIFTVHVLTAVTPGWRRYEVRATQWGIASIALASTTNFAWAIWNFVSSGIRLSGVHHFGLSSRGDDVGEAVLGASAVLIGGGILVASSQAFIDRLWIRSLLLRSEWLWRRYTRSAPVSRTLLRRVAVPAVVISPEPEHALYRRWVELVDVQRTATRAMAPRHQHLLETMEKAFLVRQGSSDLLDDLLIKAA